MSVAITEGSDEREQPSRFGFGRAEFRHNFRELTGAFGGWFRVMEMAPFRSVRRVRRDVPLPDEYER